MSDIERLEERLAELRTERTTLVATRTKEDVRTLAEAWLAAACSRARGITAGFVLNGHAGPAEVQAVLGEFLLESPALVDFIAAKVEATTELTNRQRDSRRRKLDDAIGVVEAELREAAKAAAIAAVEAKYAGEAA
jgi:hypothetical protein